MIKYMLVIVHVKREHKNKREMNGRPTAPLSTVYPDLLYMQRLQSLLLQCCAPIPPVVLTYYCPTFFFPVCSPLAVPFQLVSSVARRGEYSGAINTMCLKNICTIPTHLALSTSILAFGQHGLVMCYVVLLLLVC